MRGGSSEDPAGDGARPGTYAHRWLGSAVSRIRGTSFEVDERVGLSRLGGVAVERALMGLRGLVHFPLRSPRPFVGSSVTLRATRSLTFGAGTTFGHGSHVDALSADGIRLGRGVTVGRGTRIECTGSLRHLGVGLVVGDDVGLGTDSFYGCAGGISIGSDTIVGNLVTFHAENHRADALDVPIRAQGVTHQGITIGRDCWLGARVTVLDGVNLGEGSIVAAGAVLKAGHYPPRGVYGGVPARLLKNR